MYSIGFLDPKNMGLDTKINVIGDTEAEKWEFMIFMAAILNSLFLERSVGMTLWFPLVLESACQKKTQGEFSCFLHKVHAPFTYPPH